MEPLGLHVAELWRYPVKSMAGERLDDAWLGVDGIPGDRLLYVVDGRGEILSARTKPRLLGHRATLGEDGDVLVDGLRWDSPDVADAVRAAAGPDARLVRASGPERFDVLPLLVATDGAIDAFGHDLRRLRPNVVVAGVDGLAERRWEGRLLAVGDAVIALASLRGRCIMTTFDPDTLVQDVDVLRGIRARFAGTLALNAWAGREGRVAVGDAAALLDETIELALPALGRFA
ncbi:MAG TPA: MOSC N-terminal beta barrel domain-containing protein [Solirubrobacteraceae bacterium]|nr:MOSC N-terminal beta barrel domain-containing protein [Solirubrobacteraceae bacterium]